MSETDEALWQVFNLARANLILIQDNIIEYAALTGQLYDTHDLYLSLVETRADCLGTIWRANALLTRLKFSS